MAKIYSVELRYQWDFLSGRLVRLCVNEMRKFFWLPTKRQLMDRNDTYILTVHDRKKKEGLGIEYRDNNFYLQKGDVFVKHRDGFTADTYSELRKLFIKSGKKRLYVVLEVMP